MFTGFSPLIISDDCLNTISALHPSYCLQAILKILRGNDASITRAIMMLLDCDSENVVEDDIILSCGPSRNLKQLMFDNTGSHLVEVRLKIL